MTTLQVRQERYWRPVIGDVVWVYEEDRELVLGRDSSNNGVPLGPFRIISASKSAAPDDPWLILGNIETGKMVGFAPCWWIRKDEFLSAVSHAKEIQDR